MPRADLHIRLPDDLKAAIDAEAGRVGLSVNSLVVMLLRDALDKKGR